MGKQIFFHMTVEVLKEMHVNRLKTPPPKTSSWKITANGQYLYTVTFPWVLIHIIGHLVIVTKKVHYYEKESDMQRISI